MNARSDSLFHALRKAGKLNEIMIFLEEADGNRFVDGAALCLSWGFKTSKSSVNDMYNGYILQWRLERARSAALATEGFSTFDQEVKRLLAQRTFEELASPELNPKILVAFAKIEEEKKNREHSEEKFRESLRSKLEAGMQALFDQIKGNEKALAAFKSMKAALSK